MRRDSTIAGGGSGGGAGQPPRHAPAGVRVRQPRTHPAHDGNARLVLYPGPLTEKAGRVRIEL